MVHNFQEIDLAAFPVFGNIMTQYYISYVALRPLHRMQNAPWAPPADHQIGVLHGSALMCFSWKDNHVASGTWASRETKTFNYQLFSSPSFSPRSSILQELLSWPDKIFLLIPREKGSDLFSYESASLDSSAYYSASKLVPLRQRKTLSSLKKHISPEGHKRDVEKKPSPLSFSGRRLGWRQGDITLGLRQGLDLHENFPNSLDPELGQSTQVSSSQGTMPRPEEDGSNLVADRSYFKRSKLFQSYWKEPLLVNQLLWPVEVNTLKNFL